MYTPPYTPMDLSLHIEHAVKHHFLMRNGTQLQIYSDTSIRALIDGVADGVANWMIQRDELMAKSLAERLSDMPSELLERVSVMVAEAALASQREGR